MISDKFGGRREKAVNERVCGQIRLRHSLSILAHLFAALLGVSSACTRTKTVVENISLTRGGWSGRWSLVRTKRTRQARDTREKDATETLN